MSLSEAKISRFRMLAVLALAAATLSACTPGPEPTPTPTAAFASEEEAFAAAEETYRAYTDALNKVDVSDPSTYEPLFALSSGDFEAGDRKSFSNLHAEEYVLSGETRVISFQGIESKDPYDEVVALVCIDVSDVEVVNESGESVVPSDRPDMNAVRVTFRTSNDSILIDRAVRDDNDSCVSS